jgi:hypothetical protein
MLLRSVLKRLVLALQKEKKKKTIRLSTPLRDGGVASHRSLSSSSAVLLFEEKEKEKENSVVRQPAPSPSLFYSLTHTHRSIGYRNRNPQPLADSSVRLIYLRVYDSRVSSHQSAPSPSLCYLLTHAHSTLPTPTLITITCTQVLWCLERLTRPTVSCYETTRTRLTICLPAQPSVCEAF